MPLVKVQCSNCGGILSADTEKGTALCPFCNTPYILEKPEFGSASGTARPKNAEEIIADGILHIRMKDYRDSFEIFQEYCKSEPGDWRGRYGKAVAAFFSDPGEGLDLRSEEWELFPSSLREQKDELLTLAELCGRIRQEETA